MRPAPKARQARVRVAPFCAALTRSRCFCSSMADTSPVDGADGVPLYEPLFATGSGFVLGGDTLGAGAADDWERRRDAPTALRITIGEDGEATAAPAQQRAVRRGCL